MTIEKLHQHFLAHPIACTDTRKIQQNCIFFALKGANFNGNAFALDAIKKGAAYAVIDEEQFLDGERTILVSDVLKTLQDLASFHRNYCSAKVIAITGSNGKTTTKELITLVLSKKYRTIATQGNLNNHIGVPLTLLSIGTDTAMAVVEMGANHQKEIALLSNIAQPDYGYITNFGKAHLEGFGGEEGVIKGKSELYDYLLDQNKHIFLNADDPIQFEKLAPYIKKIGFSQADPKFYNISLLKTQPYIVFEAEGITISTQLIGKYNFTNCAAAFLIGKYFNVPLKEIKEALESYSPKNNRSQIIESKGHTIILDAYNANPTSMKAALENFIGMNRQPKTVVLGDMFELGQSAAMEHQNIADLTVSLGFDNAYLVGENFYKTGSPLNKFASFDQLAEHLREQPIKQGAVLIKGSRGMALERILDLL